ncbi:MAG: DUF4417 domain-containing protein [Erysipelotrichaceae bacterium]|nr:DUF4417 domain-containing protein [Erysipelotrichaceae bacterium]
MYRNAPLAVQIANLYRNRAIGSFYQRHGINVIPLVRWGSPLTFNKSYFPEKIAFLGIEKKSIVAIGTYGCIKTKEDKKLFKDGLVSMIDELEPKIVVVYGSMPKEIFDELKNRTVFVQYDNWTKRMHSEKGNKNG